MYIGQLILATIAIFSILLPVDEQIAHATEEVRVIPKRIKAEYAPEAETVKPGYHLSFFKVSFQHHSTE